jgi:peptidoglycan/xylan/chitin deacetylase (PgdA/CDA1 family)
MIVPSLRPLISAILALGLTTSLASANPAVVEPRMTVAKSGTPPTIALTFDACDGKADSRILAVLLKHHIPATFFVTAKWLKRNPDALHELLANAGLFELENHGARHLLAIDTPMRVYGLAAAGSPAALEQEVNGGASAVKAATGHDPRWFRGAGAVYTKSSMAEITALHMRIAGFSLAADGGASFSTSHARNLMQAAPDGAVILAHFNHPEKPAGAGIAEGIENLAQHGVRFVRLDLANP